MRKTVAIGRRIRRQQGFFSALISKNPVLVLGFDLPFVIACATSLKIAVALSIEMFIIHMVTTVAALVTVRTLTPWTRMLANVAVATVTMTFARHLLTFIFPDITNYVGIYVYLMAVNGMTIYQTAAVTRRQPAGRVLGSAFMNALAFSLTMLAVSLPRELFGNGTLWGNPAHLPFKFSGIAMPFGGFIIVGLLLAGMRLFNKKMLALQISESMRRDARYRV